MRVFRPGTNPSGRHHVHLCTINFSRYNQSSNLERTILIPHKCCSLQYNKDTIRHHILNSVHLFCCSPFYVFVCGCVCVDVVGGGRVRLKRDGTRAETRFRLSLKRTSPFKSAGASVQSTAGSRGVRMSGTPRSEVC